MATVYINNTGSAQTGPSGSWGVGSDAYSFAQAQNPSTPWATYNKFRIDGSTVDGSEAVFLGLVQFRQYFQRLQAQHQMLLL